jgi:cytochrome c oxidase cbb3-type subunit 4
MDTLFDNASSVMTVISFITFAGILWWVYVHRKADDFTAAAHLPFDDDEEVHHG